MLTILLILILAGVGTLLIVAASKPNSFRLERSLTIHASMETIYPHLENLRAWQKWSPWEALDPDLKRTYSGPPSGTGAVYEWDGNGKAGAGRMTVTRSEPSHHLLIALDFLKPFKASNTAEFTLESDGTMTVVRWAMYGPLSYMSKVMHVLINMDEMVGKDFAKGLQNLKTVVEKA